jgi:hypothetical protein
VWTESTFTSQAQGTHMAGWTRGFLSCLGLLPILLPQLHDLASAIYPTETPFLLLCKVTPYLGGHCGRDQMTSCR